MTTPPITREERAGQKEGLYGSVRIGIAKTILEYEAALTAAEEENTKLREAVNALDHALDRSQYQRTLVPPVPAEIDATRRRARAALEGEGK